MFMAKTSSREMLKVDIKKESLALHKNYKGKISVVPTVPLKTSQDLSLAYSPGVAEPCKAIHQNQEMVYTYTTKQNMVAVITDGSAVLGLGNIGPYAALPVMEGKAALFKAFADVDAFPICLNTQDKDEIIRICETLEPSFGGINLEDIAAPNCVYIQEALDKRLNIPVFHDDQDGTAIVVLAALINSLKLTKKPLEGIQVVLSGMGAAGSAIAKLLTYYGIKTIYGYDQSGPLTSKKISSYNPLIQSLFNANILKDKPAQTLENLVEKTDVFIGVSAGDILNPKAISRMNANPVVFALANPTPEVNPIDAKKAGAYIVGTGRSDYPNQINNVLVFPGLFKALLTYRYKSVTNTMKIQAALAISNVITDDLLNPEYIIPSPFNKAVPNAILNALKNN
jgi:malate dehydrogenase (oxaloacetate-decarboxylating)